MAKPGDVLDDPEPRGAGSSSAGRRRRPAASCVEFDVVGRPKGFITTAARPPGPDRAPRGDRGPHADEDRAASRRRSVPASRSRRPPARRTRTSPATDEPGRVRVQLRPARRTEAWLERLVEMDRDGQFTRGGWPRPVAGARLIRDFEGEAHAASPPPRAQQAIATHDPHDPRACSTTSTCSWTSGTSRRRARPCSTRCRTPARTRSGGGPSTSTSSRTARAASATVATQHFKGRLPYRLTTRTTTTRHEPPHAARGRRHRRPARPRDVDAHARRQRRTHVRFDWRVFADRPLLRVLTPVLRPAFRGQPRLGDRARAGGAGAVRGSEPPVERGRGAPGRRSAARRCRPAARSP